MDIQTQSSTVVAGDEIEAHGETCTVGKVYMVPKDETPRNADVWEQRIS